MEKQKVELFEDLFHTMIKMQSGQTHNDENKPLFWLLCINPLQIFRNINPANRQILEYIFPGVRRKYVKSESQATAKHKWHKVVSDPNIVKLLDFLDEFNQALDDSLLYAKFPPKFKPSVKLARLENARYDEIVAHLEREVEMNELEEDYTPVPIMTIDPTTTRPGNCLLLFRSDPNSICNYCKKPGYIKEDCQKMKKKEKAKHPYDQKPKNEYTKPPTWDKPNHPAERCWKGAEAHLKRENFKSDSSNTDVASSIDTETNNKPTTSFLKIPKKMS